MKVHPQAGHIAAPDQLVNIPRLITAYFTELPDPTVPEQRVAFGTSGHRGSSLKGSFNEQHILAITQAICLYRQKEGISGPVFMGIDTHPLSEPAQATALEVLAANGVATMIAAGDEYTPTPAVSQAIIAYNRGRSNGLADGIVITPSHNPPEDGGFKYNMTNGGPAEGNVTAWIEAKANELLEKGLRDVKRIPLPQALKAPDTQRYDFLGAYVRGIGQVIDMDAIRSAGLAMGVDPLGGAGVHYWGHIADHYRLNLRVASTEVDPTFRFMSLDWDGKIR
ncbi:MAG: phosphoglucomutase, partial [Phaeodactylibacter sp.]|nr:phosphoglucomutase [Phaeodactylibacter sp.]